MARSLRIALALGAFFVFVLASAGCGGVPGNAVVSVDGSPITKSTFNHWLKVAARSSQPPGAAGAVAVPDAPKFKKCVAAKQTQQQKPAPGQPHQTGAQLKAQCQQEYAGLRDQVLQFLISSKWIQSEGSDQGIQISDKAVKKEFERQKKQSFPKEADFKTFLRSSGMSLDDIKLRVKLDLLSNKIRKKVTKAKGNVTEKQIAAYYNSNQQRFGQPERRDLLVVLTRTKGDADKARSAIAGGQDFAAVAKKYSIDDASKSQGGKLAVSRGQQEKTLDDAVFSAKIGELVGPVKSQFGFYVFKALKDTPGSQQPLAQAHDTIKRLLTTQTQQTTLRAFVAKFQKKWKSRTECAKGFVIQSCNNAPKPKAAPGGVPPGAVPQGGGAPSGAGAPQQVPQQGAPQQVPQQGAPQQVPQGAPSQGTPQQAPSQP